MRATSHEHFPDFPRLPWSTTKAAYIAARRKSAIAAYNDRSELLDVEADGDTFIATARVSGNFPGGPITLRYRFATERGLISSLEIAP